MEFKQSILHELEQESASTRKMLQKVPEEHFGWKPHEKSFTLGQLANHVAELTRFFSILVTTDEMDFLKSEYKPSNASTSAELMQIFESNLAKAKHDLEKADDNVFIQQWKLRNGEQIYFDLPRTAVIRSMAMNHIIHHRAQLSVYLRLLNVPVPGMYGPTADEPM